MSKSLFIVAYIFHFFNVQFLRAIRSAASAPLVQLIANAVTSHERFTRSP